MMSGWARYLTLTARAKTGLSASVVVWGLIAVLGAAATLFFLCFAAFVGIADRYGPLIAALSLCGFFLLVAIIAGICCLAAHRRTVERARLALEARSSAPWLDPAFMALGLQIGRAIGWRRLVPLAAIGILAAGVAKEWFGHDGKREDERSQD